MKVYTDRFIEIVVNGDDIEIRQISENQTVKVGFEEGKELLDRLSPYMKSRGSFCCLICDKIFRSYDVKTIVRVLRKIYKTRRKQSEIAVKL